MHRRIVFLGLYMLAAVCGLAAPARADLAGDVERVKLSWAHRAKLEELPPQLLERGTIRRLFLSPASVDPSTEDCTTVAVLGDPSTNFLLRFLPREKRELVAQDWPEPSVAGAAQLTRCGARKLMLSRLAVEMRSPRGVVQFIVARSSEPAPLLLKALPHRDPGPPGHRRDIGPRASLPTLAERTRAVQRQNALDGGLDPYERKLVSTRSGGGQKLFRLEPGCHRFDVLGEASGDEEQPVDIDAVVTSVAEQEIVGEDRSDNADASVSFCIGKQEIVKIGFRGASPHSSVTLLLASWRLPSGLPEAWGARARASMAAAVGTQQFAALGESPVFATLGVQGGTALPIEVLPGACYLVVAATIRGSAQGIALAARAGAFEGQNQSSRDETSTSLAFCADGEERALLEVEAHGSGLGWLLGVWQVSRMPLGEPRP